MLRPIAVAYVHTLGLRDALLLSVPRRAGISPRCASLRGATDYTILLYIVVSRPVDWIDRLRRLLTGKPAREKEDEMKYLIVGLGNIGPEYHETRHNIGFMVVDAMARDAGVPFVDGRYGFTATVPVRGHRLVLLKPSTFMNLSGNAVRYWMQRENVPLERTLIVVDDIALPLGALRLKPRGSDGGHNGLRHIAATLGTQDYARLRVGIGGDFPRGGQIDYVLGHFSPEDRAALEPRLKVAAEMVRSYCLAGIDITMNQYNKR